MQSKRICMFLYESSDSDEDDTLHVRLGVAKKLYLEDKDFHKNSPAN